MTWQSVGQHTFVPTDREVQIGSFDLAPGQDTIWVRVTQINQPDTWPWSYGILSWRNSEGLPLGSLKAYSTRLGEVFRLGNGLAPLDGTGSLWFEPRGFNLGWLKAGFPWELAFEAQAGAGDVTSGYWNRDPANGVITPKTQGDNLDMGSGWIKAKNLTLADGIPGSERAVPGYQHGFWVPTPSLGGAVVEPASQVWSRVGNTVFLSGYIQNFTDTSSVSLAIDGAPYLATTALSGSAASSYIAHTSGGIVACYIRGGNDNAIQFLTTSHTKSESWAVIKFSDCNPAASTVYFSISYITNDTTWSPSNNATVT